MIGLIIILILTCAYHAGRDSIQDEMNHFPKGDLWRIYQNEND